CDPSVGSAHWDGPSVEERSEATEWPLGASYSADPKGSNPNSDEGLPMRLPRPSKLILALGVLLVGVPGAWLLARGPKTAATSVVARVKRGEFKTVVTTSGELRALKFVQINVPQNAQQANQYQMKISSIVPEGTIVKAGDVVAELDRSGIAARMSDVSLALQKAQAVYEQAMLDSTLNLSKAREDMRTMELVLEEKRLAKEQAVFEAPT